jgi:hypothetical protein
MRIFEITIENKVWMLLTGTRIDFSDDYYDVVKGIEAMIKVQSPSRNRALLPNIINFENELNEIAVKQFPDENGPDVIKSKKDIGKMLEHLSYLRSQLKV